MSTNSAETEKALMGCLLASPAETMAIAKRAGVRADWFVEDPWSVVWLAIDALWVRGQIAGADSVSVFNEAKRINAGLKSKAVRLDVNVIQSALDLMSALDPSVHIQDLRNAWIERRTQKAMQEWSLERVKYCDATIGVLNLVKALQSSIADVAEDKKINAARVIDDVLEDAKQAYAMRVDPEGPRDLTWVPGFRMPWPELTRVLGGLRAGLHVIAARPSVGKTSFAINLMRYWCERGKGDGTPAHVVFDSLDMPRKEVLRRFVSEKARVGADKLTFSPTKADLEAAQRARNEIAKWPLTVCEIRDVDDLRSFAMVEYSAGRLDILVIDYLGQLHSRNKEDAVEYARVSYASDTLKNLAAELQIPVIALCQLNRNSTKEDSSGVPGLTDLRGSGTIEQDAFTVTVLWRDEKVVNGTWKEKPPFGLIPGMDKYGIKKLDTIWWDNIKSQNGSGGSYPFVVRKNYFCWMLGDYLAEGVKLTTGYGATAKTVINNAAKFAKVHSDWRKDAIEEILIRQGTLIEADERINTEVVQETQQIAPMQYQQMPESVKDWEDDE